MDILLHNFEVFPKVFLGDREKTITIKPLGDHSRFDPSCEYIVRILKCSESSMTSYPERSGRTVLKIKPTEDGTLYITAFFMGEGEHSISIYEEGVKAPKYVFSVYSLNEDMKGRLPFRGDLHMHTCRSDGKEDPATVTANYRGHGYDFLAITDHWRYYPSLEAMQIWKDLSDFNLIPGEEVHLPLTKVHYVNVGGSYSVNALVKPSLNDDRHGDGIEYRSLDGKSPDTMTLEEYTEMIEKRAENVPLEHKTERISYAVLEWAYEHVKNGGGLGIYPHPYWTSINSIHVPEEYHQFIYKNKPFDAFEVMGGAPNFGCFGFQTGFYYDMRAKGYDYPVVGSTDSHRSTENNPKGRIASTIVFAHENTREGIVAAIKAKYSIAVDTVSKEYRLVGDYRLMQYASFLMEKYYPLHDLACQAEGYYMKRYLAGDERAEGILKSMRGQIADMQKKFFDL